MKPMVPRRRYEFTGSTEYRASGRTSPQDTSLPQLILEKFLSETRIGTSSAIRRSFIIVARNGGVVFLHNIPIFLY